MHDAALQAYVPDLLRAWTPGAEDPRHMRVTGSLAFVDISGFTALTERLARKGKVGAEEMSDVLNATFAALLSDARLHGADLVKWGGDAVLLLFRGPDHAVRAARSAHRMRATLRDRGRLSTATGALRMSVGVHSGDFDFFLVGDRDIHLELLISGPGASRTAELEAVAEAGQIALSDAACALVPPRILGDAVQGGRLLRSAPSLDGADVGDDIAVGHGPRPAEALPVEIREHLLSGSKETEHRLIAVAFVQFSGTDALLEDEGPAVLAEELDQMVRNVQEACLTHRVTFFETDINRDGGKVMLTAGAPRSAGHDDERMLRVARLVLDRAGRLPLRIGVNRGRVFSGDFGPPFRRTYSVKGDAINLAARVMGKASKGQALATLEVIEHSETLFETTQLDPFMVKGKTRPVVAADVGALTGHRVMDRPTTPLTGRDSELATLREALADAREGRGRAVEVVGEGGMGKSRLLDEVLDGVYDVPATVTSCQEYESSTAYFPFRAVFRELLGVGEDAPAAEAQRRLVERLEVDAPHLLPWLPLLGLVMDVPVPSTPEVDELDDQFRKERLEEVVKDFLGWMLPSAAVLVFEDVHLADDASADLLRALVADVATRPWLVAVTRTPGEEGYVAEPGTATTLTLKPLSHEDALELVRRALDGLPLTSQALSSLAERGSGHPMFLEALATEARDPGSGDLPESVEGLLTSQIDRLDPHDRAVLRTASVLGANVDLAMLRVLVGDLDEAGVLQRLSHFLGRDQPGKLRFRNALLRDVAYEGLPYRRRRTLHDSVGQALEAAAGENTDASSELLSLHFFHAGRFERAWRYSVTAGERAVRKHAHADAIDFLARAVESSDRTEVATDEAVADVLVRLADSYFVVGRTDDAEASYAQARRHVHRNPVVLASIIEKEARIDQRRRRLTRAMQRITRGLHALDHLEGRDAEVARSLLSRRYAFSRYSQGRVDDAISWARSAAEAAQRSRDPDALAQAYEMLNAVHAGSGRREPAPYGRMALRAYVGLGNLPRQGHCLNNLAVQAFRRSKWNDALADYRRAADIFRRIGDSANESNALYNQAELLVRQGRGQDAAGILDEVLRNAAAVQDDELVALALREQARVVAGQGDLDEATATLRSARDLFTELAEDDEVLITDLVLAEVLLDASRTDRALALLTIVVGDDAARLGAAAPTALRLLARARAVGGELQHARELLQSALEAARKDGNRYEEGLVLRTLAGVRVELGLPYRDVLRRATRILLSMGVVDVQPTMATTAS
jgi:class 3 adenylate cyclase/tetratricopeptide (TPR) repeat protein